MDITGIDSLHARRTLDVAGQQYDFFSIAAAAEAVGFDEVSRLPFSMKVSATGTGLVPRAARSPSARPAC
jgi:hypothetical protein